jgi:hypothetical protein
LNSLGNDSFARVSLSGLELYRQPGGHPKMVLPPRQFLSGLVIKYLRQVLESAGPANAVGAFKILVTSPEFPFIFLKWAPKVPKYPAGS